MDVDLFNFESPGKFIALRPTDPPDGARTLAVNTGGNLEPAQVRALTQFVRNGDTLVANHSRVIPERLMGRRLARAEPAGAEPKIEVLLFKRLGPRASWRLPSAGRAMRSRTR